MSTTSRQYVTVAGGQRVSLAAYARAVRLAKSQPETEFRAGLSTPWPTTGAEVVRQFLAGVHDRINRHDPQPRGKWAGQDRARHLRQLADRVNGRIVVRRVEMPLRWQARLAHRLHEDDDF